MRNVLGLFFALVPLLANAWNDLGHSVIAKMAYAQLTPKAKRQVDALLKVGVSPKYQSLAMASVWADATKNQTSGPWHYINLHFRTDGEPVTNLPADENVVSAIQKFAKGLSNKSLSRKDGAEALRYLLHLVADAHQPLHCVARDSVAFPNGDRGGNDFPIKTTGLPSRADNLHSAWDYGCGVFVSRVRVGDGGREGVASRIANEIAKQYPPSSFKVRAKIDDPNAWTKEGLKIAKDFVYTAKEKKSLSKSYLTKGQRISRERAALAAYRLANALNKALTR